MSGGDGRAGPVGPCFSCEPAARTAGDGAGWNRRDCHASSVGRVAGAGSSGPTSNATRTGRGSFDRGQSARAERLKGTRLRSKWGKISARPVSRCPRNFAWLASDLQASAHHGTGVRWPVTRLIRNNTMNTTNRTFATAAAVPATTANPITPAINAMMRNVIAQPNMIVLLQEFGPATVGCELGPTPCPRGPRSRAGDRVESLRLLAIDCICSGFPASRDRCVARSKGATKSQREAGIANCVPPARESSRASPKRRLRAEVTAVMFCPPLRVGDFASAGLRARDLQRQQMALRRTELVVARKMAEEAPDKKEGTCLKTSHWKSIQHPSRRIPGGVNFGLITHLALASVRPWGRPS